MARELVLSVRKASADAVAGGTVEGEHGAEGYAEAKPGLIPIRSAAMTCCYTALRRAWSAAVGFEKDVAYIQITMTFGGCLARKREGYTDWRSRAPTMRCIKLANASGGLWVSPLRSEVGLSPSNTMPNT